MNTTIWKFKIEFQDVQGIEMPKGAQVLDVQKSDATDGPVMWALVDPDAEKEIRYFYMRTTGNSFDASNMSYLGTFQYQNGAFVGHLFEVN